MGEKPGTDSYSPISSRHRSPPRTSAPAGGAPADGAQHAGRVQESRDTDGLESRRDGCRAGLERSNDDRGSISLDPGPGAPSAALLGVDDLGSELRSLEALELRVHRLQVVDDALGLWPRLGKDRLEVVDRRVLLRHLDVIEVRVLVRAEVDPGRLGLLAPPEPGIHSGKVIVSEALDPGMLDPRGQGRHVSRRRLLLKTVGQKQAGRTDGRDPRLLDET